MKTETQTRPDLAHLARLIDGIPVAMLTTIEADGALASCPMWTLEMDASGALWFFTDLRSGKIGRLRMANLSYGDASRGTWVSLSGHGEIVIERSHIQRLWSAMAKPWFPDGPDSPELALLKFVPDAAEYWDAPSSKMVRTFGLLAAVVTGKPVAMGEHGSHTGLAAPAAVPAPPL